MLFTTDGPASAEAPKIVATVNGVNITEAQVDAAIEQIIPGVSFHPDVTPQKRKMYWKDAIEELIISELLYQEAVRLGIAAPEEDVRKALDEQKARFGSESELEKALREKGVTLLDAERDIRRAMAMERMLKMKVEGPSRPLDSEVKNYYGANKKRFVLPEQIKIFEIFIYIDPYAEEETVKERTDRASEVFGKAKAEEDFCMLVKEYSDDELRDKCGDMGYFHRGQLDETLEKEVWEMKEGEMKMVTIEKGIMIVKFGDRKAERLMPFDEVKAGIEKHLAGEKMKKLAEELIKGLREKAKVVIY